MRDKLIELIGQIVIPYWAEQIADHLIANGVTFADVPDINVENKDRRVLLDADAFIKYLKTRQEEFIDDYGKGWSAGISAAISACEKFPKVETSMWKSRDEAPKENGIYCVYAEARKGRTTKQITFAKYKNGKWTDLYDNWENKSWQITHWMPKPEPPKEGDV